MKTLAGILSLLVILTGSAFAQVPEWTLKLPAEVKEIEQCDEVDGDKLLIRVLSYKSMVWLRKDSTFILLDKNKGEQIWVKASEKKEEKIDLPDVKAPRTPMPVVADSVSELLLFRKGIELPPSFTNQFVRVKVIQLGDTTIVYNQFGIVVFKDSLKILQRAFRNNDGYNIEYLYNKLQSFSGYQGSTIPISLTASTSHSQALQTTIARNQATMSANSNKMRSNATTSSERSALARDNTVLAQKNLALKKEQISAERTAATIDAAGTAAVAAGGALIGAMALSFQGIAYEKLEDSKKFYQAQFQYPYFVWFTYENNYFFHLLDVRNFSEATIQLGNSNENYRMYCRARPFFKFSSDKRHVYLYSFSNKEEDLYRQSFIAVNLNAKFPSLSLTSFNLVSLKFQTVNPIIEELVVPEVSEKDRLLFEHVVAGDSKKVEEDLVNGANANARKGGVTPLMVAASLGSLKQLKVLIENGASPVDIDMHGWVAWHYAVLHGINSWPTQKLRTEYHRVADDHPWNKGNVD